MLLAGEVRKPIITFFFNDTATTAIYTLSLHDALPIWGEFDDLPEVLAQQTMSHEGMHDERRRVRRSEEHTSELQSRFDLECRLLLEKKNARRRKRPRAIPTAPSPDRSLSQR